MIQLDRNSTTPLYLQIYQHIRDEIAAGELQEGAPGHKEPLDIVCGSKSVLVQWGIGI